MGFHANILHKVDAKSTLTGEQIERFLDTIVARVVPRSRVVPSYKWLQQGLGHLVNAALFYFKDFTLSKHERSRFSSAIDRLFEEGKLTKGPAEEKHHIGAYLVRKLTSSLFVDALTNGTINWDVTLAKPLSIVITAALASRTGDVAIALLEIHDLPFLAYKDITLKVEGGHELTSLVAKVVIRNEKGTK
jgi:hypothetical protein